ncbi:MAG: tetratricopeptide repeat protein [Treponema sp.]|jgi:tetratricopeptide (TPR) repeat protein|nr:tetratricopeptide repeat protein [Treponema sp.]
MKLDPILAKAARFARSGKYESAIRTLEPEDNRYYGSFRYYYLLGVSCLHVGDFGGALNYFRLAQDVKLRDPLVLLGLAVLYLRRGETDRAVDFYLDVQELDEKNRIAKRALKVIRKYAGADSFSAWLESGKLSSLYPPVPSPGLSPNRIFIAAAAVLAALALCFGALVKTRIVPNPFARRDGRKLISEISLNREERNEPVQIGGAYRYILTRTQVLETYERALSLFTNYRDEAAKINVNRILESNASEGVKNRSRILLSYMEVPGFDNFKQGDNVSYSEALKDPVLFRDVHVIWRGMATNMETVQNISSFDFLVGYDTRKTLEGIVPVVFDKAISLNLERPLEVLGRIVPVSPERGAGISLEGIAIHQSGQLVPPAGNP